MKFGSSKFTNAKETTQPVKQLQDEEVVEDSQESQDLNSTAFSLTRHPEGGFALVEVKFNPVTMLAKVSSLKKVSDSREEAEYYFRVRVGEFFANEESKS
jgi:hypothetical protein